IEWVECGVVEFAMNMRLGMIVAVMCGVALCGSAWAQPIQPTDAKPTGGTVSALPAAKPETVRENEAARTLLDLEYAKPDGQPVKLDLFLPAKEKTDGKPVPVVIWIHGGGWMAGSKSMCPAKGMLHDGFAVASVEYRFSD